MEFRTEYHPNKERKFTLSLCDPLLLIGSCFSDNMGQRMTRAGFQVLANPLGTLYNPASINKALAMVRNQQQVTAAELINNQSAWHHMMFHSAFSSPTPEKAVQAINQAIIQVSEFLEKEPVLIITLGTSMVYKDLKGEVVANCHKLPPTCFERSMLTIAEIEKCLRQITGQHKSIVTISPIRHLADGMAQNSLSKAQLITAAHQYIHANPQCTYFPAYEIMNDDLRDYRFYAADMKHPSEQACDYIFDKFLQTYCDAKTQEQARMNTKHFLRTQHRPLINE